MNVEAFASQKSNNLNLMKWIAAILVIFSHAYAVTGIGEDPLFRLTGNQITFGGLAFTAFFFANGFYFAVIPKGRGHWCFLLS